jgi:hypothetical protein
MRDDTQNYQRLFFGSIAGLCILCVIQFAAVENLDKSLHRAIICFAITLPLAIVRYLQLDFTQRNPVRSSLIVRILSAVSSLAPVTAFVGAVLLFWHFDRTVGITFLVFSIIALVLFMGFVVSNGKA